MMSKTKRKRLVVLALLAFFCCGAVTGVDWHRAGLGFLALLKGRHEPVVASGSPAPPDAEGAVATRDGGAQAAGPRLARASRRHHAPGAAGAGGGHRQRDDEDLFKYGLPAAGGIPAGSFVVAQNDAPAGGDPGPSGPAAPSDAAGPASSGGDVGSPAPGPADAGVTGGGTPSPSPAPDPPGGSDPGLGDTGSAPAPVSAVPETSPVEMMGLAALFIAVAASRRRRA